jgi:hypothetical protein
LSFEDFKKEMFWQGKGFEATLWKWILKGLGFWLQQFLLFSPLFIPLRLRGLALPLTAISIWARL